MIDYKSLLASLITAIPDSFIPDLKVAADALLDKIEEKMADNELVMAIVKKIRTGAEIPDLPDAPVA